MRRRVAAARLLFPHQITPVMLALGGSKSGSHSHYGTTANNRIPLLAFADGHTAVRDDIEGHLRCIGWRAVRRHES